MVTDIVVINLGRGAYMVAAYESSDPPNQPFKTQRMGDLRFAWQVADEWGRRFDKRPTAGSDAGRPS